MRVKFEKSIDYWWAPRGRFALFHMTKGSTEMPATNGNFSMQAGPTKKVKGLRLQLNLNEVTQSTG